MQASYAQGDEVAEGEASGGTVTLASVVAGAWRFIRKATLALFVLCLAAAVVAAGYKAWQNYELSTVRVELLHKQGCEESHPLAILVRNSNSRALHKTTFVIEGRKAGHSTNLVSGGMQSWDKIVAPQGLEGACWQYPLLTGEFFGENKSTDKSALEWKVRLLAVEFGD